MSAADDALALAERFFAAIEAGDLDAVRACYADDATVWHNHDGIDQSREDNLRTLAWVVANVDGFRYTDVRRRATDDGFVQQHVARGTSRGGVEVAMPACIVVTVADGRIARLEEYLDSRQAERFTAR